MPLRGSEGLQKRLGQIEGSLGDSPRVRVGFLENATYPDGKSVAMIAAIHTYGKWPFFQNMIAKKSREWPGAIGDLLVDNNFNAAKTLDLAGHAIAGQLRQEIIETMSPRNAPSTVARKGFDKPLVDSGHMLQSVDHQVLA